MHENAKRRSHPCGAVKKEKGIQRLEAMLYALDLINADSTILPGVTLGALILDTCSSDTFALEQSMEFVRSSISQDLSNYVCEDGKHPKPKTSKPVVGVIGASFSGVSVMVANILRLFKIPQISYASTSTELSDKSRFDFFSRVVPPDNFQVQALVELLKKLGWGYVSTIAVEGEYGEKGIASFTQMAEEAGICIAVASKVPRNAKTEDFDLIIERIGQKRNARGVVIFVDEDNIRKLLAASIRLSRASQFLWIGSDSWGAKIHPVKDLESAAEGAITILPKRRAIPGFDRYFQSLRPKVSEASCKQKGARAINKRTQREGKDSLRINCRNVWFQEFWKAYFNCSFKRNSPKRTCTGNETITNYSQEGLVPFVVDAVYAMAKALHNMAVEECGGRPYQQCPTMDPTPPGDVLLRYVRNVTFVGLQQQVVKFNRDGDPIGSYDLFQYQKVGDGYDYVLIGEWGQSELSVDLSMTKWRSGSEEIPTSVCSLPCPMGYIRNFLDHCCWNCVPCRDDAYIFNDTCVPCDWGWIPSADKSQCYKMKPEVVPWTSPWVLVPVVFSSVGIVFTSFTVTVFIRYKSTPIIMASGRELCYVLLVGIAMCYLMTFSILSKPSTATCTLTRVGLGLCLCVCYSAIFTKTNRIFRIFHGGKRGVKRPSFISPRSQIIICLGIVSIQLFGSIIWLIIEVPSVKEAYATRSTVILVCGISTLSLIMSLIYNIALIVLCTLYAFKTRKIPENFNEAKYIGFTMYSTCIVWLAYIPIYFGTQHDYKIQQSSTCICVSLNATVALACLFSPKLYIVLFQPYKNVRQTYVQATPNCSSDTKNMRVPRKTKPISLNSLSTSSVSKTLISENEEAAKTSGEAPSAGVPSQ